MNRPANSNLTILLVSREQNRESLETAILRTSSSKNLKSVPSVELAYRTLTRNLDAGGRLPDLVLLDMALPEAPELLKNFSSTPLLARMPVVALIESLDPREMHRARELGAKWSMLKSQFAHEPQFVARGLGCLCAV